MGGDSIGHCENRSSKEHVSNSERCPTENCLKFIEGRRIHETNFSIAFLMLPLASRSMKTNSEEQHAIFAYGLRSALRMTLGFSNINFDL